jgi:hypothetical protein
MEFDPHFQHPFSCLIAGPTGSGKTQFVKRLLTEGENAICGAPEDILWCYGEYQPTFQEEWVHTIPSIFDRLEGQGGKRTLVVIDDLMSECVNDKRLASLFSKKSHHRNCSVIFIVQNVFVQGKEMRNITQNCHYMVLFKNPRDASIINHLGKQMYPGQSQFLKEAYHDATSQPYGYLLIDLKQSTPDALRLRTELFSSQAVVVYTPRQ